MRLAIVTQVMSGTIDTPLGTERLCRLGRPRERAASVLFWKGGGGSSIYSFVSVRMRVLSRFKVLRYCFLPNRLRSLLKHRREQIRQEVQYP